MIIDAISPGHSLSQLEQSLGLFLASAADQKAWVDQTGFPAEEIALQYYDTMHALPWLREHELIDAADEAAFTELLRYVQGVQTKLFVDREDFIDGWYVTQAPEWQRVRELASIARASLRRPVSEKTH